MRRNKREQVDRALRKDPIAPDSAVWRKRPVNAGPYTPCAGSFFFAETS
jgi:hypothetical protein